MLELTLTRAPAAPSSAEVTQPPAHTFWGMEFFSEITAQCKFSVQQIIFYLLEEDEPAC